MQTESECYIFVGPEKQQRHSGDGDVFFVTTS